MTSGGDQIFPRGMPVGTVEGGEPDPDRDPLVDVVIRPAANLSRLEEVLVITDVGEVACRSAERSGRERGRGRGRRETGLRCSVRAAAGTDGCQGAGGYQSRHECDNTGENVRLMTPPKPLQPDQYSPDATPPSAEMTPGQRHAPVLQGTEEIVAAPPQRKPTAAEPAATTERDDNEEDVPVKNAVPATGTTRKTVNRREGLRRPAVVRRMRPDSRMASDIYERNLRNGNTTKVVLRQASPQQLGKRSDRDPLLRPGQAMGRGHRRQRRM